MSSPHAASGGIGPRRAVLGLSNPACGILVRSGASKRNPALEKWVFTFFRMASEIAKETMPDPLSKAGVGTIGVLAKKGEEIERVRQESMVPEIASRIDSAFIFLDDLDRCDADVAWAILRSARRALPTKKTISIIVCDPVVLGHHVSHVLGVPLAHGFQAVLKYIDVPLKIPMTFTPAHAESIKNRIESRVSVDWQLEEVACAAVGSIPMRDILAALPQACTWLASWDRGNRCPDGFDADRVRKEKKAVAEVIFFIALLHVCLPNVA